MRNGGPSIIYLAGKMSGLEGLGFDRFHAAAEHLRDLGIVVINPAETAGGDTRMPREWFFAFDFDVINIVDAIVVLPNWTESRGAKGEVIHGTEVGIPVYLYSEDEGIGCRVQVEGWEVDWSLGRQHKAEGGSIMVEGSSIRERVYNLMKDGRWRSLEDIQAKVGGTLPSVSARLRDLRKEKYGGHTVESRRKTESIYVYRLQVEVNDENEVVPA